MDGQEYIRRQLEEEQRHLEMLQEQLLREQAMLLVSMTPINPTARKRLAVPPAHLNGDRLLARGEATLKCCRREMPGSSLY